MKTNGARSAAFILGVAALVAGGFAACGSDKKDDDSETDTKISFTDTVNPILKASCSGSTCHSVGASGTQYVDKESVFKASVAKARLNATDGLKMPQAPSTISATNKQTLLDFLAQ